MRDILLNELRNKFDNISSSNIVESRGNARSDTQLLAESKRHFPHLTESQILENRRILDNINFFKLTVKEIQANFPGMNFAEARAFQKAAAQFAILEYHSRVEGDDETYLKSVNESCKVILELEPFTGEDTIDPNSPEAKQWAKMMAATKGKGQNDTIGNKMDFSSGKEAPEPEKKKGFFGKLKDKANILSGLKSFIKKSANFVVEVAKNKQTHKALAIGAVMVVLSALAPAIPGGAAILGAAKGLLGLYGIFKGSKGMLQQGKELSGGKPGVDGVKEYLKNVKNVKSAASLIGQLAQIGIGAWGSSSAAGDIMKQIQTSVHSQSVSPATPASNVPAHHDAPAAAPAAPAAPDAPKPDAPAAAPVAQHAAAAAFNPSDFLKNMRTIIMDHADEYLADPDKINQKIFKKLTENGINLDGPIQDVIPGAKGNMSVRDYIEMAFEMGAKAKSYAGR